MRIYWSSLGLVCLWALLGPAPSAAQGVVARSPNLSDGWVGEPGTWQFHFNHRFWVVPTTRGDRVSNSPSFLLGVPLTDDVLLAGRYASNSLVASEEVNETEIFVRWAIPVLEGSLGIALEGGYNGAAESADGEVSVRAPVGLPGSLPVDSIGVLGSARVLSDVRGSGEVGWFFGAGLVFHFGDRFSIAADGGSLSVEGQDPDAVWGAAVQMSIPASPHTLSLQATNTRTGTHQGASFGGRTVWGFEFTVPLTVSRWF